MSALLRNALPTIVIRKAVLRSVSGNIVASKTLESLLSIVDCSGESVSEVGTLVGASNAA